ncbi:MAG: GTP cyclohydrolase I [Verrucomicrobiales bacterium]
MDKEILMPEQLLPDIQATGDERGIAIDRVGVSDLEYPIQVMDAEGNPIPVAAKISMSVHLPHHFKGTHMSRFLEVLSKHEGEITMRTLPNILHDLKDRLDAESAHIEVGFSYFITKQAPVTKMPAKVRCHCTFIGESNGSNDEFILRVETPVTTLCPCSKEISARGAHNQRGYVTTEVKPAKKTDGTWELILIEELVDVAERSGSSPIYALLKRPDEKYVTEEAYDNPVFVEDVVRNAAAILREDSRIASFTVKTVNHESIHDHNAFAIVSSGG